MGKHKMCYLSDLCEQTKSEALYLRINGMCELRGNARISVKCGSQCVGFRVDDVSCVL